MKKYLTIILFIISFVICGCSSDGIPEISGKINILGSDFSKYQIRHSRNIFGPDENSRFVATDKSIGNFYLSNADDFYYYYKWSRLNTNEIIGVHNNKIMVHLLTTAGFKQVKHYLPNAALDVNPKRYKLEKNRDDIEIFVWEFDNGYLALYVLVADGWQFYEQQVINVLYVKDKKYLPLNNPIKS